MTVTPGTIGILIFVFIDTILFFIAEMGWGKNLSWWYILPFGGFVAVIQEGIARYKRKKDLA